jgi:hypothetical protein
MSPTIWQDGRWLRAAFIAAVALTLTLGNTSRPAFAEEDEEDKWDTIDNKILRGILSGLGLKRDGEGGIDYHERSPLVVPPSRDLPVPQNAATMTNDPAWPKDPDVTRKKTAKKKQRNTVESEENDMRQLSPSELRGATGSAGRTGTLSEGTTGPTGARPEQLAPGQLGHGGLSFGSVFNRSGTAVQFTGEPPRSSLTEPPPGLRTPSSRYSYGSKGVLERVDNTKTEDRGSYGTNR